MNDYDYEDIEPQPRKHRTRRDRLQDEMPELKFKRNQKNKQRGFKSKPKGFKPRKRRQDKW